MAYEKDPMDMMSKFGKQMSWFAVIATFLVLSTLIVWGFCVNTEKMRYEMEVLKINAETKKIQAETNNYPRVPIFVNGKFSVYE